MNARVSLLAANQMARRLTTPFARGSDTQALALVAGANTGQARVVDYDFAEHRARFDHLPAPRYVLMLLHDLPQETRLRITYSAQPGGPAQPPITLLVPAGTLAGTSLLLNLGPHEGPNTRLSRLTMTPAPAGGAAMWWRLTALLGNMAKLLWVLGWERDHIRRQLARAASQRHLNEAVGLSLDLLGYDLGIPRFPPLPYSFDEATLALYHLNDRASAAPAIEDLAGRYPGRTGHHGVLVGAVTVGATARFGRGIALEAPAAAVQIPHHPDFDLAANQSFTAECYVRPRRGAGDGHILSKHPNPVTTQAGWALSVGDFGRGLPHNLRWLMCDGVQPPLTLFADLSLPPERFTHVAGVIDRTRNLALLYVDGQLVAQAELAGMQAVSNGEPVQIGHVNTALQGVVEEVRFSNRARSNFHPVLGEEDEIYRQRLRFFRQWVLPTPANLATLLNAAVGPIDGNPAPFVINERNTTIVGGARLVTVHPARLLPGECVDRVGRRRVREVDICGRASDEKSFDSAFLLTHQDPRVSYAPPEPRLLQPNELPPDTRKMQLVVEGALNRLLDLIAAEAPAGKLTIAGGFDPRAPDLRATGRALRFSHPGLAPARLGALAQQAGFDFICHEGAAGVIYAACAPGEYVEIVATPSPVLGAPDVQVGDTLALTVRPALPPDTGYRWLTVACGAGAATLGALPAAASITLQATAPGELLVTVDITRRRNTVAATRLLRIGIKELANGDTIGSDGMLGVGESRAGTPDPFYHLSLLVNHSDARVNYGADTNHHLMQPAVAIRLTRLLDLIDADGAGGTLRIVAAFDPNAADLASVGRRLLLRHSALDGGQLAALAFAAGFSFVRRQDPNVELLQAAENLVTIDGPAAVEEGHDITLTAGVKPGDVGPEVRLQWTLGAAGQAAAELNSTTQPTVTLRGIRAGPVRVAALYLIGDAPAPYTFEVRLDPALEAAGAIIRKEQYDLVMNMLNAFHPIGIEVTTQSLRQHVVELQGNILDANPEYTYPKFHARGPLPHR